MQDPLQQNIEGSKQVTHSIEHKINWGHAALGVGLLALAYALTSSRSDSKNPKRST